MSKRMNKLILAFLIAAFLLVLPAQATIYVGGEVDSISDAIEAANENDTIVVYEGIYRENVVIDKPIFLKAEGNVTIEAVDTDKEVVLIEASNVVLSGFNVKGGFVGIGLVDVQGSEIENNSVFENKLGIGLLSSSGNSIQNNLAFKNEVYGILLQEYSDNNKITNNTACENGDVGLRIHDSSGNDIYNNVFNKNFKGILLRRSNNNEIRNNSAFENELGIGLLFSSGNSIQNNLAFKNEGNGILLKEYSNNNEIRNNTASENGDTGLKIQFSSGNDVYNNIVNKNLGGILLIGSNNTKIANNTASENSDTGLGIQFSSGNDVYNNIVNKNLEGILLIGSNNTKIANNTASENSDTGLGIQFSSGNDVYNNVFNKNSNGIVLLESNNTKIANNTASENGNEGLRIDQSSWNDVCNNIFNNNLDGILLIGSSNNNEIANNTACENIAGLCIQSSSGNDVSRNIVNKNLDGISLIESNNNEIANNTASENGDEGLCMQYSVGNVVCNNIFNKNLKGILLMWSNNNTITNNTAYENGAGCLMIEYSSGNAFCNNVFNNNLGFDILLIESYTNEITNNNIVDSKGNQVRIENAFLNKFNYNYWSDYDGEDKNNDGIGDEPYEIEGFEQENYYDYHPHINYSGWLNVVITPEFWEFFTKKGDVNYFYKTFSIENRLDTITDVEIELEENLEFEADETNKKTFTLDPKATKNITIQLNTRNLEGYILRKIIFKTEEYTKTTLVNGFVQPKIHHVRVEGVDFHRNVVKGQINPFNVILRNHGDNDEFEVKLKMGREIRKTVYLNETETKTLTFEIDTSNMPLGINRGQVLVSKDEQLDYLNLTMFVASEHEASTLIVTNLSRFNESKKLRSELIRLTHHPAVNGILLDVTCNYSELDLNYKANKLCEAIKNQIEVVINEYQNIKYLIIVGDDRVIPFYRVWDGTKEVFTVISGLPDESVYYNSDHYKSAGPKHISDSVDEALSTNHFLTDDFYAHLAAGRSLAVGRLVEKPDEIIKAIDMFFNYYQLTPTDVFVTGYDFMYDGSEECFDEWSKRIDTTYKYKYKKSSNYANPNEIISELFNSSISAIFLHANYDEFEVPSGVSVVRESLDVEEINALNGSIIYTMGCHAGLTIPDVKDLPQTFLSHGTITYIAPTGYGLGGIITVAGHEKLLEYLTKRIARGEEIGFALLNAKNDYYLDNFNQDMLDEKVLRSLTLYGFPMYAVRLDSPSITAMIKDLEEPSTTDLAYYTSSTVLEEATLILKPSFKVYETENGTYYSYESYTTEAGMPILPKATWYFIRGEKEIRGIVLHSARFDVNETRLAIETFAVSDGRGGVNELKGWYPTIPFTLNTIEDRQNIVIASAQYKVEAWWSREGIIRLFNEIVLDIFRVPVDAEREKPVVNVSIGKGVVTVKAEDDTGIYDVLVTYLDAGNNSWVSKSPGHSDSGRRSVDYNVKLNNTVFFVQAVDVNGNVKIDDNRGDYYAC